MATKKHASAPAEEAAAPARQPEPRVLDLNGKIAAALEGKDDYVYVEVVHGGQTYVAWRSRNGAVHVENRGA
jgi:hypothetical protein